MKTEAAFFLLVAIAFLIFAIGFVFTAYAKYLQYTYMNPKEPLRQLTMAHDICLSPIETNVSGFNCITRKGPMHVNCKDNECFVEVYRR